jgi:hypothetical protein
MKLQGRNLSNGTRGDDVRLLHTELRLLGFRLIPDSTEIHPGIFGPHTLVAVREFQEKAGLKVTGIVDEKTAQAINARVDALQPPGVQPPVGEDDSFVVRGRVTYPDGRPLAGVKVRVFDRDLRREELLGEVATDNLGRYEKRYQAMQLSRAEKGTADLVVRAFGPTGAEVAASPTLFNAGPDVTVDLVVDEAAYSGPSELEQILTILTPLLEGLPLHELTEKDLEFLIGETGLDAEHLGFVRLDAVWNHQSASLKLPQGAFYGLLRQGLPSDWPMLLRAGPQRWRGALKQAIADRQVPAALAVSIDDFMAKLTRLAIDQAFEPLPEGHTGMPSIGVLLAGSAVSLDVQRKIAAVMLDHTLDADPGKLWSSLQQAGVPEAAVRSTRFALEAHSIVAEHLPTLRALQSTLARDFGAGTDLARLSRPQWLEVAQTVASNGAKTLPKDFAAAGDYAESLADRVELAFPTAVVAHRLVEDAEPTRRAVGQFLVQNPGFDLLTTPVEAFLGTAKLDGINASHEALTKQLATEVRVARIAPAKNRAVHMTILQAEGFDSATKVALTGGVKFKSRIQKITGQAAADEIHRNAKHRAKDLTVQVLRVRDPLDPSLPVLPSLPIAPGSPLANWVDMFGSANGCFCPPCQSVHGPGAYLMDLLQFLEDMKARRDDESPEGSSLFDVLDSRRPDLKHLKLSCANAETPLPYIDLVNELLERAVLPPELANTLPTPQTPEDLDDPARLRALPEENATVLSAVYAGVGPLQSAVYPWQLPFDRGFLHAGIYFSLIGTSPAEVLALTTNPGEDLHRARLGLSSRIWALLHGAAATDGADVSVAWGLPRGTSFLPALTRFSSGRGLIARSGLPVDELFKLIESRLFAGWSLYIDRRPTPEADPCDIADTELRQRLGSSVVSLAAEVQVEVFDLMHRVLRLRLALGWPLERLQSALQALGVGRGRSAIDLVALSRLVSLSARLGVSVENLSEALIALGQAAPSAAEATHARARWLALLRLSEMDHAHLVAVGLADSLAPQAPAQRLERLESVLETLALLGAAGLDPAELRYLLRDEDLVPAVFMPLEGDLEAQLDDVVAAIRAATADLPARVAAAIERLAEITGTTFIDSVIADSPTGALLAATGDRTRGVVQDFIGLAVAAPDSTDREAAKVSLRRVLKTCRLLGMLKLTAADTEALTRLTRDNRVWLDFNTLPVGTGARHPSLSNLLGLVQVSVTQSAMPKAGRRLLQVIAGATDSVAASTDLENATGWGRTIAPSSDGAAALRSLAQTLNLPATAASTWQTPDAYVRLHAAVLWLQAHRLTIGPGNALATMILAARAAVAGNIDALRTLAAGRFATKTEWYKALTPAMDRLRAQQRDALLAHLLHTGARGWKTADDVYAHLLIDVQMGPCQLSSRIVQAHAAIQLFVQRCLMNLEKPQDVALGGVSDIAEWRQWEWMKNYRVWEAGRKVFLYAENWIEPDLRDVKSPFFEGLENELLQDEITPDTAERAVRGYLTRLLDVANLDIRALYEESYAEIRGDGRDVTLKTIHMVGRTRAMPHAYFYRQRLADLSWTPWEKLELSIDAEHLVLVVHNRRPMLFWPQFKEVQIDRNDPPKRAWDMQLNWTVREFGQWAAPARTLESVRMELDARPRMLLRPEVSATGLDLNVYHLLSFTHVGVDWPLGYAIAGQAFSMDSCTGKMSMRRLVQARVLRLPRAVLPHDQLLEESVEGQSPMYLRLADPMETPSWLNPELMQRVQELATTGGLGGAILAAFIVAALVHADAAAIGVQSRVILKGPIEGFTVLPAHQFPGLTIGQPYVFTHLDRPLYALIRFKPPFFRGDRFLSQSLYILEPGHHAFVCDLIEAVRSEGLAGLYRPAETPAPPPGRHPRQLTEASQDWVRDTLHPNEREVATPYPFDEFDFSAPGAYALYNWEVFFHIPLLLADRLSKTQRFEDAQQWLHAIFDPTDVSPHPAPQKYWRVKPLFREAERWAGQGAIETLEAMMRRLSDGAYDVEAQVAAWRNDPFNPHLIARLRLVAYMKTVVQKYIENLIDWADSLFRRDTMESINEATQLYVLGNEVLGPAPMVLPPVRRESRSYAELIEEGTVDELANVLVGIESGLPVPARLAGRAARTAPGVSMLYFCIPSNPRLHELRATIADRLFKIRHCMNIDGNTRQLALFAPAIDPALLVRARAAGLDIGTALDMALGARSSHYRFQPLLQKALEFCGEVRSFGNALLSALEKRDGEQLAQLRARHEVGILKLTSLVKEQQVREAEASLETIQRSRAVVQARLDFYSANLAQGLSPGEAAQISHLHQARGFEITSSALNSAASIFHALPTAVIGFPCNGTEWGGPNIGHAMQAAASALGLIGQQWSFEASMSGYNATYGRRADEWRHQIDLANRELVQMDQQMIAAEIRLNIVEQEQRNHEQQIAQSEEAEAMLRDKFTNAQLYSWMSAQLAALHYQSYRMAFDLARQAEAAAQQELPDLEGTDHFIQLDHWDSARKGLLAAERLAQDLRRLEVAYLQNNARRLEITSHLSLRRLNPSALWSLRTTGRTGTFAVPKWLFDLDFPGHANRRIKSVSVSVPCVVGPYVGVNGILSCTSESPARRIATSSGQNDAGVFQLDFRDERNLPFEWIDLDASETRWELELPAVLRPFDYATISDVVLHIQYTARYDESARDAAAGQVIHALTSEPWLQELISIRHDFPTESRQLREGGVAQRDVALDDRLFPYFVRHRVRPRRLRQLPLASPPVELMPSMLSTTAGGEMRLALTPEDADSYFLLEYALNMST